eukprot:1802542-Prymnesium_polylepis.1
MRPAFISPEGAAALCPPPYDAEAWDGRPDLVAYVNSCCGARCSNSSQYQCASAACKEARIAPRLDAGAAISNGSSCGVRSPTARAAVRPHCPIA